VLTSVEDLKMSSDKIEIEKLRGADNYASWKILMELYLTHKGLDNTIKEDRRTQEELNARSEDLKKKESDDQKKALALIGLRVNQEYLGVIIDAGGEARAAWQTFEKMFQSVTNARKLMLRQKLASLRMEPGEKAAQYISRAKDLKRDLVHAQLDAKEVDLAAACGLSKDYREIRMMLEYQEKAINLDEMLPLLLQHEARLAQEEDDDEERQSTMAFSSRGYKSNFKKKDSYKRSSEGNSRDQSCFTCGKPGHRSTECEKNPHKNQKCFKCGKRGHVKTDCRSKNKEEQSEEGGFKKTMIFTVSNSKKLDSCWLLDSGATHHLSGNSENFLELKEVDGEITVEGVSSDLLRVEGIGTVELFCKTPDATFPREAMELIKLLSKGGV
jgi:hypothetical protein